MSKTTAPPETVNNRVGALLPAARGALTAVGMILVSLAVWRFWTHVDAVSARILVLGALALLGAEVWGPDYVARPAEWNVPWIRGTAPVPRPQLLTGAVALSIVVDGIIFVTRPVGMSCWLLLAGWFVSMILLLGSALPAGSLARMREVLPRHLTPRSELFAFLIILALAAATRLIDPTLLYPVRGDEAYHVTLAQDFVGSSTPGLFTVDYLDDSYIYYVPQHFFYLLFGDGLAQARFSIALMGLTVIPPAYLLARELFNRRVAVVASLILAVEPLHLNYSRINVPQVYVVAWTAAFLYCFLRGLRTGKAGWWIAAGLAAGLAQYGHTDARFIAVLMVLMLAFELIRAPRAVASQWSNFGWFLLAAILAYGPTFFYTVHDPSAWGNRGGALNIFSSGWFSRESSAVGVVKALMDQISLNAMPILTATPSSDSFYPSGAFLPPWSVPFAVAGFIRCAVRSYQRAPFVLLAWSVTVFVLGGLIIVPPFGSQHLIELTVPLAFLAALGVEWVAELRPNIRPSLALAIACVLTLSGLVYFFVQYPPLPAEAGGPTYKDDTMTQVGYLVRRIRPDAAIYIFDTAYVSYHGAPEAPWLAGGRSDVVDVISGTPQPPLRLGRAGAVFLFLPSERGNLPSVKHRFPGGKQWSLLGPHLGRHALATIYAVGHPLRGS